MFGIIIALVKLPHCIRPDAESFTYGSLVIEHTILNPIRFARIVQYQAFIVFGARIHHLAEHVKARKYAKEGFVQTFTILDDIFT